MKNTSKARASVYLFNAYSNLDSNNVFISGSDRVGLKFLDYESRALVIAPEIFKTLLPKKISFISSDSTKYKNLHVRYLIRTFKTIFILLKLKRNLVIDKIISTSDFYPDTLPCYINSRFLSWYAFTYHLYPLKFNLRDLLGRILQIFSYYLFKNSFRVITTSTDCENFLKKNFRNLSILKIPLGIDLNKYKYEQPIKDCLVYLGRIKKSKGVFDLPEIVFKVKKVYPNVTLKIIGNGDLLSIEKLENLIKKFKLENNIKIYKNLSDFEVLTELQNSKILVQPSYEEGFGLSILEALAANLKVVAFNLPVYQEHFSNFELNVVPTGDTDAFSNKIIFLLKNPYKTKYSPELFQEFSWPHIFKKIFKD